MFKKMKDAALSKGAKVAMNSYIKEYGKMLKLNLDSKNKSIALEVLLEGEKEPLSVNVQRYELTEENGKNLLKIYGILFGYLETLAFQIRAGNGIDPGSGSLYAIYF
jgi:hypothetical protein